MRALSAAVLHTSRPGSALQATRYMLRCQSSPTALHHKRMQSTPSTAKFQCSLAYPQLNYGSLLLRMYAQVFLALALRSQASSQWASF